jgi:hypothetical protein
MDRTAGPIRMRAGKLFTAPPLKTNELPIVDIIDDKLIDKQG